MSHFMCPECGTSILEGPDGYYFTECPHFPIERKNNLKPKTVRESMKKYTLEGRIEKLEQALKIIQIWAEHYQDDVAESVLHDIERKCQEVLE